MNLQNRFSWDKAYLTYKLLQVYILIKRSDIKIKGKSNRLVSNANEMPTINLRTVSPQSRSLKLDFLIFDFF
ncbi:unnamed protein product [Paramecium octaurelia]|uniref:Uncharacterized protein n=1 Tax=Paramecium octaurelia TaxID=43137 RepID=A0A8S1Y587_PAROT|nr:unnamed protein product [Paramecium octaurelia]